MRARLGLSLAIVGFTFTGVANAGLWFKIPKPHEEVKEFGKSSMDELDPNNINVLIWNQYKGNEKSFRSEYQRLSHDRDVLLLQEAFLDGDMDKIYASNRNFKTYFAASFVYRWKNRATGVANAARTDASSYLAQRSRGTEIAGNTPKMIMFTTYPLKGRSDELLSVNIHALNSVTWQSLAVQILDAIKVVKEHEGPVVFGGDFNTWSKKKMDYMKLAMKKAGLEEVRFANEQDKMQVFGRPLDHAFVRGATVRHARVEKTNGADHQPLLLTLRVR